jgi:hypothetical protein
MNRRARLIRSSTALALGALALASCGSSEDQAIARTTLPLATEWDCSGPIDPGLLATEGQRSVRVILTPGLAPASVLRLAERLDSTKPDQTRELVAHGILSQSPPDCDAPALFLGIEDVRRMRTLVSSCQPFPKSSASSRSSSTAVDIDR